MGWQDDPVVSTAQPAWMNDPIAEQGAPTAASLAAAGYGKQPAIGAELSAVGGRANDIARQIASGITLGGADRLAAAAGAATGIGGTSGDYSGNLARQRTATEASAQELGTPATLAANLGGNVLGAAALPAEAFALPASGWGAASKLFGLGAGAGVAGGTLSSPDWRDTGQTARDALVGALSGGALGVAIPGAIGLAGKTVNLFRGAVPQAGGITADNIGDMTNAAYAKMRDLGAAYSPDSIQSLANKIAADAKADNINEKRTPKAFSAIEDIQQAAADAVKNGTPMSLDTLDKGIRQVLNRDVMSSPDASERYFGAKIRGNIDDFVNSAFPGNMAPMPAPTAAPAVTGAARASIRPMTPEEEAAADFSGGVPERAAPSMPASSPAQRPQVPPGPAPTPMLDFLRRGGGLQDEGGDLASMGFADLNKRLPNGTPKGTQKIIDKENGRPNDEGLRAAKEAGYMPEEATVADFINKIGEHPTYSVHDQEAVAARAARDEYDYGPSEEAAAPEPTISYEPAVKIGGKIFRGQNHSEAAERAAMRLGVPLDELISGAGGAGNVFDNLDGFINSDGQFVNRNDAYRAVEGNDAALAPGQTASAQEAADAINAARDLYMRKAKTEKLAEALSDAELRAGSTNSGGNIDNATRQNLRRVLKKGNFTPEETEQYTKAIMGGLPQNTLRWTGKVLNPSGFIGMSELAAALSGHPSALGLAALGYGAKKASDRMTRANVENLLATHLAGGKASVTPAAVPNTRNAVAAVLAGSAGPQELRRQGLLR